MKKVLIIMALLAGLAVPAFADTNTPTNTSTYTPTLTPTNTPTPGFGLKPEYNTGNQQWGNIWIMPTDFRDSDGVTRLVTYTASTVYYGTPSGSVPGTGVAIFPTGTGVSVTASFFTPADVKEELGNFHIYAVVKVTTTAYVAGKFAVAYSQQSAFDSLTNTTVWQGVESRALDARAATRLVLVDCPVNTVTGSTTPPIRLRANRYVNLTLQESTANGGNVSCYGILVQYRKWFGTGR